MDEYAATHNRPEALACLTEIAGAGGLALKHITDCMMDESALWRAAAGMVVRMALTAGFLSEDAVMRDLVTLLESLPDLAVDVPKAPQYVAQVNVVPR